MATNFRNNSANKLVSNPRRLPAPPQELKRISRPLPKIPRPLACKKCGTCVTSHNVQLPQSAIPSNSRPSFQGFSGKASLFTEIYNVVLAKAGIQLMVTGAHTMQEITCATCSWYLGWKIIRAHDISESWKNGHSLLELEHLYVPSDTTDEVSRRSSSGSDSTDL